jgi:outer membrane protein OmpA-like peptidoglycan-associated protein
LLLVQGKLAEFSLGLAQIRPATARHLLQRELGDFALSDRDLLALLMNDCHNIRLATKYIEALYHQFASAPSVDEIIAQVARSYSGAVTPSIQGLRYVDAVTGAYHLLGKPPHTDTTPQETFARGQVTACIPFGMGAITAAEYVVSLRAILKPDQFTGAASATGMTVHLHLWHNDRGPQAYVARLAAQRQEWLMRQLVEMGYTRDRIIIFERGLPTYCGESKSSTSWAAINVPQDKGDATAVPQELEESLQGHAPPPLTRMVFNAGQAVLKPTMVRQLAEVVKHLQEQPTWRVQIIGHTDAQEVSPMEALRLSRRRVDSVVSYLVQQGVHRDRILPTAARGLAQPVAPNNTPESRAQNRRVEVSLHPES